MGKDEGVGEIKRWMIANEDELRAGRCIQIKAKSHGFNVTFKITLTSYINFIIRYRKEVGVVLHEQKKVYPNKLRRGSRLNGHQAQFSEFRSQAGMRNNENNRSVLQN